MSLRRTIPARSLRPTLALTLALTLASAAATRADEVVLVPNSTVKNAIGGRVRGSIKSESSTEVVVKLGETTTSVPIDQIVSINYDGQPPNMVLAESNEASGQVSKALDLYKKSLGDASGKPFIEQAIQFKVAALTAELALSDPARTAEAIGLLDGFVRTNPTSRHIVPALESLARLQLQKGDFAGLEKSLASLSKLPSGADRAAVYRARILAKKGDHAGAIVELDRLIKSSAEGSVRQRESRLAKVESLTALKKYAEAEAEARSLILALPPEDAPAMSAAYNALGDSLRAAGRPKDALLAYLKTDLLYYKDKEQHPRALAHIVQLWRELKREDRADEVLAQLKHDYPQSPWLTPSRVTP